MLECLGINKEEITENTDFIVASDIGQAHTVLNNSHGSNNTNNTVLGTLSVLCNGENGYDVFLNNGKFISIPNSEINKNIDIRIAKIKPTEIEIQEISY